MKELIFLFLIMAFLVCVLPAMETTRLPGAVALDIALPGYSAEIRVVVPDTDLALLLNGERSASISVLSSMRFNLSGQPSGYLIKPIDTGQGAAAGYSQPGYWLRL
jgi:hypothetical protein